MAAMIFSTTIFKPTHMYHTDIDRSLVIKHNDYYVYNAYTSTSERYYKCEHKCGKIDFLGERHLYPIKEGNIK